MGSGEETRTMKIRMKSLTLHLYNSGLKSTALNLDVYGTELTMDMFREPRKSVSWKFFFYNSDTLLTVFKLALNQGLDPYFCVYRNVVATVAFGPFAYYFERKIRCQLTCILEDFVSGTLLESTRGTRKITAIQSWPVPTFMKEVCGFLGLTRDPPPLPPYVAGETKNADLKHQLIERDDMLKLLRSNLVKAQDRMRNQANTKRHEQSFQEGDYVFVRIQPYRQKTLAKRRYGKLSPRFYGPYRILRKVRLVAYKLELPPDARIHLVFYVSMLKPAHGSFPSNPAPPLPITKDWEVDLQPIYVLAHRWVIEAGQPVLELLILWCHCPAEKAAWENYDILTTQFPDFRLEDKAFYREGSNDTLPLKNTSSIILLGWTEWWAAHGVSCKFTRELPLRLSFRVNGESLTGVSLTIVSAMVRSNSVLTATKLFEFVISEKLALSRALKPYLMRGSSSNASTLNNSRARTQRHNHLRNAKRNQVDYWTIKLKNAVGDGVKRDGANIDFMSMAGNVSKKVEGTSRSNVDTGTKGDGRQHDDSPPSFASLLHEKSNKKKVNFRNIETKQYAFTDVLIPMSYVLEVHARFEQTLDEDKNAALRNFDQALVYRSWRRRQDFHLMSSWFQGDDVTSICDDIKVADK
ncbi:copia protein [Tanacetum coccineum]|uniref:Copia protein n=1 Tax=Tanacetum coccineum TaxID=301880 RepID=A0ABQ4ZA06_9ASTR